MRNKNGILFVLATVLLTSLVLPFLHTEPAHAAVEGEAKWINIATIEYDGVYYYDPQWDKDDIYVPLGSGYDPDGTGQDEELNNNCITWLDITGLNNHVDIRDTALNFNPENAVTQSTITVHKNNRASPTSPCEPELGDVPLADSDNAKKWFYLSGDRLVSYYTSAEDSEAYFVGPYDLVGGGDIIIPGVGPIGVGVNLYITSASYASSISINDVNNAASWTLRLSKDGNENESGPHTITIGASPTSVDPGAPVGGAVGAAAATCESTGIGMGWLVCGVLRIIDNTIGFIVDSFITDGLGVEFKQTGDVPVNANRVSADSYANTYSLWATFRTIANIMFVIAFLVMIFGQTIGLDAYMIKKMAPRIAIAAILVQLSWVLSVEVLHWVNIIGGSIDQLIYAPFGGEPPEAPFLGGYAGGGGLVLFGGFTIAAAIGLIGSLALGTTIALALLGSFATVVFRNVLIFILLVISPIAAVLWILPNTERYAKQWWSWFIKALLVYPMIIALIAVGKVASTISTTGGGSLGAVMGIAVYFAPYFMIPFVFKFAGGAIAGISGYAQGLSKQAGAKTKEWEQPRVAKRRGRAKTGTLYNNKFGRAVAGGLSRNPMDSIGRVAGKVPGLKGTRAAALGGKARAKSSAPVFAGYNESMKALQAAGISDDQVLNAMATDVMSAHAMETKALGWDKAARKADARGDADKAAKMRGRASQMRNAKAFAGDNSASVGALLLNQSYGFANDQAVAGLNNSVADAGVRSQILNYGGALAKSGGRFDQGPGTYQIGSDGKIVTAPTDAYTDNTGDLISQEEFYALPETQRGQVIAGQGRAVALGNRSSLPTALKGHELSGQKPKSLQNSAADFVNVLQEPALKPGELTQSYSSKIGQTVTLDDGIQQLVTPEFVRGEEEKIQQQWRTQEEVQQKLLSQLSPNSNMDVKSQLEVRKIIGKARGWDDERIDQEVANLYRTGGSGRTGGGVDHTGGPAGAGPTSPPGDEG